MPKKPRKKKSAQEVSEEVQPLIGVDFGSTKGDIVIVFVGKREQINKKTGKVETVYREAPTERRNGGLVIKLPSSTKQRKGFTHPDAEFLLTAYRKDYKRKALKGVK